MTTIFFLKSQNYFWSNATFTIFFFIYIKKLIQIFFISVIKSDVYIGTKLELITDFRLSYKICYEIIVKIL